MQYVDQIEYISITKMMAFVLEIIKTLEPQGTVRLDDVVNTLKLSLRACFPFGNFKWFYSIDISSFHILFLVQVIQVYWRLFKLFLIFS